MKTLDEEKPRRMTNKEFIVALLTDDPRIYDCCDYQSEVYYRIACPYFNGDEKAKCHNKGYDEITKRMCEECKCEWLEEEVTE